MIFRNHRYIYKHSKVLLKIYPSTLIKSTQLIDICKLPKLNASFKLIHRVFKKITNEQIFKNL